MNNSQDIFITEEAFRKRYEYGPDDMLGEGGFAQVYKAYDKQFEEYVALKFYNKGEQGKYDVLHEMKDSRSYSHKNIIRVHDAFLVRFEHAGIHSYVQIGVLEFANGGNLRDFIAAKPDREVFRKVLVSILNALEYLHADKVLIHRDLSPENILMYKEGTKWIPKIADFGISKKIELDSSDVEQKKSTQLMGKTDYMAPEQFYPEKFGINGRINTNVDIWAFGIILYEIFLKKTPFGDSDENPMRTIQSITSDPLPDVKEVPEPYRTIIKQCLRKDAHKRIQAAREIITQLEEPNRTPQANYAKTTPLREFHLPGKKSLKKLWISLVIIAILIGGFFIVKEVILNRSALPEGTSELHAFMDEENYEAALDLYSSLNKRSKRNPDISLLYNECVLRNFVEKEFFFQAIAYYKSLPEEMRSNAAIKNPYLEASLIYSSGELSRLMDDKSYAEAVLFHSELDSSIKTDPEIIQIFNSVKNAVTIDSLLQVGIAQYDSGELAQAKSKFMLVRSIYDPQNQDALEYIQKIERQEYIPPAPTAISIPSTPDCKQFYSGSHIILDQKPNLDEIRLISICLNDSELKISLELQPSSHDVSVYPPGHKQSYYIEFGYPKQELRLQKLIGWDVIVGSVIEKTIIELVFDPLPKEVKKCNLKEGEESIRTSAAYWDFIGIRLAP